MLPELLVSAGGFEVVPLFEDGALSCGVVMNISPFMLPLLLSDSGTLHSS